MPPPGGPRPREPGGQVSRSGAAAVSLGPPPLRGQGGTATGGRAQGGRRTGPRALLPSAFLSWAVWKLPTMDSQHLDMLLVDSAVALGTAVFSLSVSLSLSCVLRTCLPEHLCHLSVCICPYLSSVFINRLSFVCLSSIIYPHLYLSPAYLYQLSVSTVSHLSLPIICPLYHLSVCPYLTF